MSAASEGSSSPTCFRCVRGIDTLLADVWQPFVARLRFIVMIGVQYSTV